MSLKKTFFVVLAMLLLIWAVLTPWLLAGCAEKKEPELIKQLLAAGLQVGDVTKPSVMTVEIHDAMEITQGDIIGFAWADDDRLYLCAYPHGSGPRIRVTNITFELLPEEAPDDVYVYNNVIITSSEQIKVSP